MVISAIDLNGLDVIYLNASAKLTARDTVRHLWKGSTGWRYFFQGWHSNGTGAKTKTESSFSSFETFFNDPRVIRYDRAVYIQTTLFVFSPLRRPS